MCQDRGLIASHLNAHARRLRRPHTPLVENVARNLRPAPHVRALVDAVVANLTAAGPFNGLHLRAEEDARMWDQYPGPEASAPLHHILESPC